MTLSARGRSLLLKTLLGLAITGSLLLFLLRYVDLRLVGDLFRHARWPLWLTGLGIWLLIYFGRALRFVLLAPRTPYGTMFCIAAVHNFLLRLLPFRTGELSYAFLVRRAGSAGLGESLLGLLLIRILDSTCVVILFAVALAFHHGTYLGSRTTGLAAAAGAALLGLLFSLLLTRLLRLAARLTHGAARLVSVDARPRVQRVLGKLDGAVADFARVKSSVIAWSMLVSVILWLLTFAAFHAIMRSFSMPVTVAQTVLGSTAAVVTGFLPIGGIGSFGTLEAGWALGFVLVGLERQSALASGFGVSISTFIYGVLLGLVGWIGLSRSRGRAELAPAPPGAPAAGSERHRPGGPEGTAVGRSCRDQQEEHP